MAEPENLIMVYLRRIDEKIDRADNKLSDLTLRVNEVHSSVIALRRDQVQDAEIVAHIQTRMDKMQVEIDRINRRFDIKDA
ncbi:MAG: hypothetical protein A3G18_06485 [Rhodospirillales bacterium RIFCSPLOWO2_12_FULL_58_28]|nr:MAG: hypothetical protein A3H92_02000 [Rhodospirillales bacterium RIFCSPLOWO2_02_FULL_58_16]OHC78631.1 MAG: hypothetical protein A3G18_06485 [Rhodospirillales bacterium RIFCSPLOWO2_12_FULL_58_28]